MPAKRYVPGPASSEPLEPILDGRLVEKIQAQLAYTRKPDAPANFPGVEVDPLWPELVSTLAGEMKRRRSQGAFTSSEVEQGEESLFLQDFSNVVRTKLFHEGRLAELPSDAHRLNMVRGIPSLSGGKSPRDFLTTKLGMAKSFVALDIRIMQVLHFISPLTIRTQVTPGSDATYNRIETALVEQVCPRFGISPAELDQWLFRANERNRLVKHLQSL